LLTYLPLLSEVLLSVAVTLLASRLRLLRYNSTKDWRKLRLSLKTENRPSPILPEPRGMKKLL